MAYGLIGLYGLYLVFVGYKGNQSTLFQMVSQDGPGFMPWLIAVVVLGTMYRSDTLKPVVKPFIALLLLTFVLKNFNQLKGQLQSVLGQIQTGAQNSNTPGQSVTATPVSTSPNWMNSQAIQGVENQLLGNVFLGGGQ